MTRRPTAFVVIVSILHCCPSARYMVREEEGDEASKRSGV